MTMTGPAILYQLNLCVYLRACILAYTFFERCRKFCVLLPRCNVIAGSVLSLSLSLSREASSFASINVISPRRHLVTVSSRRRLTQNKLYGSVHRDVDRASALCKICAAHYSLDINFAICVRAGPAQFVCSYKDLSISLVTTSARQ